jgi:hypothetical protein
MYANMLALCPRYHYVAVGVMRAAFCDRRPSKGTRFVY